MADWPHAPVHRFTGRGVFFVTAGTYLKRHYYRERARLDAFVDTFFSLSREHSVSIQSWALFSNHYHIVANAAGESLRTMLSELHSIQGHACNRWDNSPGRQVWYQFRDTELTFERSWLARLRYTQENPVKHGLVQRAADYPWCSAAAFERNASPAFARTLARFRIDRVNVPDAFEPILIDE